MLAALLVIFAYFLPGTLVLLVLGGSLRSGAFVLKSFGASFLFHAVIRGLPAGLLLCLVLSFAAWWRSRYGTVAWPQDRRRLAPFALIPVVFVVAFRPFVFDQWLTGDGLEALESGWSLMWRAVPRFPSTHLTSLSEGTLAMAFPIHWFVRFLGPVEAAARLPMALYLPVLFAGLLELIEQDGRALRFPEELALLCGLAAFTVAMCLNSTYDAYSADISSPGASFETLTMVCVTACILFAWTGERNWLVVFAVIGMLARPTVPMLVLFVALGVLLVGQRRVLPRLALALVVCALTWVAYEYGIRARLTSTAYRDIATSTRLRYLTFTDWARFGYAAISTGLLPFVSLAFWKRQDALARSITGAVALYFALFYVQAFGALHYFVPAMILPLVVYWRQPGFPWRASLTSVAALLCLGLSLPAHRPAMHAARPVACQIAYQVGNYRGTLMEHRAALQPRAGLKLLVPTITPSVLVYYATRCGPDVSTANVVVRADTTGQLVVTIRDSTAWRESLRLPRTDWRSPFYATPFTTLRPAEGIAAHAYQLDVATLPGLWRLFRQGR